MQPENSAERWAECLRGAAEHEQGKAESPGSEPTSTTPVRTRGAVTTRGAGPSGPAPSDSLRSVLDRLFAAAPSVRLEVVRELLRRPDNLSLAVLREASRADPLPNVRWAIADGLRAAPAAGAVPLLEVLAREDSDEMVRSCAIGSLGEIALAAYRDKVDPEATPQTLVRARGAVRTRGASAVRTAGPEALAILDFLERLRDQESGYVREIADVTLRQLGE